MINLPIHITAHHLTLDEGLRQFVRRKIGPLNRFANDAISAEVVLRQDAPTSPRFSATARIALPGRDIHGHASGSIVYVAIGKLASKIARLSRKRKTRLAKAFTRAGSSRISLRGRAGLTQNVQRHSFPLNLLRISTIPVVVKMIRHSDGPCNYDHEQTKYHYH
jgi:putative sigma-54 modulation protein